MHEAEGVPGNLLLFPTMGREAVINGFVAQPEKRGARGLWHGRRS